MAILEEAIKDPVADLHGGAEHDGHVLETHLVVALALDDVLHVTKDPLHQTTVALG